MAGIRRVNPAILDREIEIVERIQRSPVDWKKFKEQQNEIVGTPRKEMFYPNNPVVLYDYLKKNKQRQVLNQGTKILICDSFNLDNIYHSSKD
jgi:hypothetical protein